MGKDFPPLGTFVPRYPEMPACSHFWLVIFFAYGESLPHGSNFGFRLPLPTGSNAARNACYFSAASRVFCISIAIVIGPTPPGTGVIKLAVSFKSSKSQSPVSLKPDFFDAS